MKEYVCRLVASSHVRDGHDQTVKLLLVLATVFAFTACQVDPLSDGNDHGQPNPVGIMTLELPTTDPETSSSLTPFGAPPTSGRQDGSDPDGTASKADPHGRIVAFVSERRQPGDLDIWLVDTATGQLEAITSDNALDSQLRWSRSGQYLAFLSLWPDGDTTIRIQDMVTDKLIELDPGDDPVDFDWLASEPGLVYANSEFQIRYLRLDGSKGEVLIEGGRAPSVSPSGDRIAFIGTWLEVGGERLAMMSLETSEVTSVIDDPDFPERGYIVGGFDWSPGGQEIIEAHHGGRDTIPLVIVYNVRLEPLTSLAIGEFLQEGQLGYGANLCSPIWLGDSGNIVFVYQSEESGGFCVGEIYNADSDLETVVLLTNGSDFASPIMSPDDKEVIVSRGYGYLSNPALMELTAGETALWIMNQDGSDLRLLTDGPGYDGEVAWRPVRANQSSN